MRGALGVLLVLVLASAGCSDNASGNRPGGTGGAPSAGGAGGSSVSAGTSSGGSAGNGGSSGGGGTAGAAGAFPNGGQQYKTIVNIVDPAAVAEIEGLLTDLEGGFDPVLAMQAFYALYPDEYDFVYLLLDHELDTAQAFAAFEVVNRPVIAGTGLDTAEARAGYGTNGRLKGIASSMASTESGMPPFAHETLHYWANHVDPALGFGRDLDNDYGAHWGQAGVFGQLGGFDPATLRCANPAGAMPPACTAEANGRFRYTASAYGPHTNSFLGVVYAPLELYMMGLAPVAEVPSAFPLLENASFIDLTEVSNLVEADGVGQIEMSAIVSRHGNRAPAAEADKHFTSAFVLVTAAPAGQAMLDQVVEWQEIFGNYAPGNGAWISFEEHCAGRATLSTRIGRRRTADDPDPVPPTPTTCDVFTQDCGTATLGCYGFEDSECLPSGGVQTGGVCVYQNDCAPGTSCNPIEFDDPNSYCTPYCDPNNDASPVACATLCPNNYIEAYGSDLTLIGGNCLL